MNTFALLPLAVALLAPATSIVPTAPIENQTRADIAAADTEFAPGRLGGPGIAHDRVEAFSTDVFSILFRGQELASVFVRGDGDTDLDLFVYDEAGNLVASDTDSSDLCLAQWRPRRLARYRIEVRNLGSVYNNYVLETN